MKINKPYVLVTDSSLMYFWTEEAANSFMIDNDLDGAKLYHRLNDDGRYYYNVNEDGDMIDLETISGS